MGRAVDLLSVVLLLAAAVAFVLGIRALGQEHDLLALYWLIVGGLGLRSATELLRPRSDSL